MFWVEHAFHPILTAISSFLFRRCEDIALDERLERLQVKARGLIGDRFTLTVNGRRIPIHPTGTKGEGVAGVRYRAWQPPECLHPTIGVDTPLAFDLYDTWAQGR